MDAKSLDGLQPFPVAGPAAHSHTRGQMSPLDGLYDFLAPTIGKHQVEDREIGCRVQRGHPFRDRPDRNHVPSGSPEEAPQGVSGKVMVFDDEDSAFGVHDRLRSGC